jgi:periplasmic divalent cation tolerance protein
MLNLQAVLLYVTTPSAAEGERIGRILVEEGVIACANVIAGMTSIYRWQGEVQRDEEAVVVLKTQAELADAVTERVKALHPYECPCVLVLSASAGNAAFVQWISHEVGAAADNLARTAERRGKG